MWLHKDATVYYMYSIFKSSVHTDITFFLVENAYLLAIPIQRLSYLNSTIDYPRPHNITSSFIPTQQIPAVPISIPM